MPARARTLADSLTEQNRARWDQLLIRRGLAALSRAEALGGGAALTPCRPRWRPAAHGAQGGGDGLAKDRGALRQTA